MDSQEHAAEREALLRQVRDLQAELDAITPLRRHLLAAVRHRVGQVDRAAESRLARPSPFTPPEVAADGRDAATRAREADTRALDALRAPAPGSPALTGYRRARAGAESAARRVLTRLVRR